MKRMGQIEKRKKKGRPSKADLAARLAAGVADSPEKRDIRRSLRRRNFRYNIIDYDEDYLDVVAVLHELTRRVGAPELTSRRRRRRRMRRRKKRREL